MKRKDYQILDVSSKKWSNFVEEQDDANIFHHPNWANLISDCYGYKSFALAVYDPSGHISSGLPVIEIKHPLCKKRWVSMPYTDCCPILAKEKSTVDRLLAQLKDQKLERNLSTIEIRGVLPSQNGIFSYQNGFVHKLLLSRKKLKEIDKNIKSMHQKNILKAKRQGVIVTRGQQIELIDAFYRLHLITRKRLGVPIQPKKFFRMFYENLIRRGLGFVSVAYFNNEAIAAAIFLNWNRKLIYKYGASNHTHWDKRPNNLIFSDVIRWAYENGYPEVDFGRTGRENIGLRNFKKGWGTEEKPLLYSVIADKPPLSSAERMFRPLSLFIRHSPPLVCRVMGELAYKYVA